MRTWASKFNSGLKEVISIWEKLGHLLGAGGYAQNTEKPVRFGIEGQIPKKHW